MKQRSAFVAVLFTILFATLPVNASDDNLRAPVSGDTGGASNTVPAPSTLLLMAGAAGLLALKRKKR